LENVFVMKLFLSVAVLLLVGCSSSDISNRITERSPHLLKNLDPSQRPDYAQLMAMNHISDLFEVVDFVALETTEDSLISNIQQVLLFHDQWIVLDITQSIVFSFTFDGRFIKKIGRSGQGPGEYLSPMSLSQWRDLLVINDGGRGALLLYDRAGEFVGKLDLRSKGIIPGLANLFTEDYWYAVGYNAVSADHPAHAKLRLTADTAEVMAGFGERFAYTYRKDVRRNFPDKAWEAAILVDQRIWLGSPYGSQIDVFDLEGRFVASLESGLGGAISQNDYLDAKNLQERRELEMDSYALQFLIWVDPFVLATYGRAGRHLRVNLYDAEGNLLRKGLTAGKHLNSIFRLYSGNFLIWPWPAEMGPWWEKMTRPEEYQNLLDQGFKPEAFKPDDNPVLILSVLKPALAENR
jgi:hypothetical protein